MADNRHKLTDAWLKSVPAKPKRYEIMDAIVPGLRLGISAAHGGAYKFPSSSQEAMVKGCSTLAPDHRRYLIRA